MLYFAYGSNLNHFQMKRRCKDSFFLKKYELKGYRLNFRSKYRAADIEKKKNSIVSGGLFEISKSESSVFGFFSLLNSIQVLITGQRDYLTMLGKETPLVLPEL